MKPPAREQLIVIWHGEEAPGFIVYGLTSLDGWTGGEFPLDIWPEGTEVSDFRLYGERWEVMRWDVALAWWPRAAAWRRAIHDTLTHVIAGGCVVSWLGCEGCPFSDPPGLLSPEWMSGGVLAALTSAGEFDCPIDPDLPIQHLSDDALLRLRRHAHGLADVS